MATNIISEYIAEIPFRQFMEETPTCKLPFVDYLLGPVPIGRVFDRQDMHEVGSDLVWCG